MASTRSRASKNQPSTPSRDAKALIAGPRNLRSSGTKPLAAAEADHYEALSRKRRSPKVGSSKSKPVIIPDDERKLGSPDPAPFRDHGRRKPVIRPLATIALGQERIDPDSNTIIGVLQRLDNASKQILSIISARWGRHADLRPLLTSYLEDVHRVGSASLALRCDLKLVHWDGLARRAERLAFFDPPNEVSPEARAQVQARWEKEVADIQAELDSFTVLDCA